MPRCMPVTPVATANGAWAGPSCVVVDSFDATPPTTSSCTHSNGAMSIILALPGKTFTLAAPDEVIPVNRSLTLLRRERPVVRLRLTWVLLVPLPWMSIILALSIEWVTRCVEGWVIRYVGGVCGKVY